MPYTLLLHIANEEPTLVEVDKMPTASDTLIIGTNPRRRDGKDLPNLAPNVMTVIWPMTRMIFIEIMPSSEEEKVVGFVRE
jgi:hypothetical protein